MRISPFLIFFSIVLTVYGLINYYIFRHAIQAIPVQSRFSSLFTTLFVIVVVAYPVGRFLERAWQSALSDILTWTGAFWLAAMFYFFLLVVVIDLISLVGWIFPGLPSFLIHPTDALKTIYLYSAVGAVGLVLIIGHLNALHPRIRTIDVQTGKKAVGKKQVTLVMASDIHLGTIIGPRRVGRLVNTINGLKPDVVLLCGDVVDEDLKPVIRQNLGEKLRMISAPLGVYGIMGNHEYIGGAEAACKYLQDHGITMLRDQVANVNGMFYLAGREDRSRNSFAGRQRMPLNTLLNGLDHSRPVVLMDHQPFQLSEAEQQQVTLQLSGHTHNGQLWPLNYIIDAIYELGMGEKEKGATHYYVSPGYGSWGPPVRTGHRPELAVIHLNFD